MPTVFRINGYRFFFFSNEGFEPIHIHVEKGEKYAKYWLKPISLAKSEHMNSGELSKVFEIIKENEKYIEEKWNDYFSNR